MNLELVEKNCIDTLTGHSVTKAVLIHSGAREIYIGIEAIKRIVEFLKNFEINLNE